MRANRWTAALLLAALALVAACSGGDDGEPQGAETVQPTATASAPAPKTRTDEDEDGGLLEGLGSLLRGADLSACVSRAAEDAPALGGGDTVAAVARDVERLRGLSFRTLPRPRYLTGGALDRRLVEILDEYPAAELAADARSLVALRALPPGADLRQMLRRALSGGVAGFYDPRTGELVVDTGEDPELSGVERVTLAHELDHALVDQALGLPETVADAEPPQGGEDGATAELALVEGDATLAMEAYAVDNLSFVDALRSIAPALAARGELEELPYVVRASLLFPYTEGLSFTCELYRRGGWRAVDRAYRELPRSTAEVLFPQRYRRGPGPVDPADPGAPGAGWQRLDRQAFGAADLLWLFEAPGDDESQALDDARARAGSWAGGELHAWARGAETAVVLALVERAEGGGLCDSVREWAKAAHLRPAVVTCRGHDVRVGIAPDAATARRILFPQRARRLR